MTMFDIFKKAKKAPAYDYSAALARLTSLCSKSKAYTLVFPSVFYDMAKGKFAVHFECANREYFETSGGKHKYFLSVRRDEKFWSEDLETLLDFCVTYAQYDDAFVRSPQDNLPPGVTISIKNFKRVPRNHSLKWKTK